MLVHFTQAIKHNLSLSSSPNFTTILNQGYHIRYSIQVCIYIYNLRSLDKISVQTVFICLIQCMKYENFVCSSYSKTYLYNILYIFIQHITNLTIYIHPSFLHTLKKDYNISRQQKIKNCVCTPGHKLNITQILVQFSKD